MKFKKLYQNLKIYIYKRFFSQNELKKYPIIKQPTIFNGKGSINFDKNVQLGFENSEDFYSGSTYIEAREQNSSINIGENTVINNSASIIADRGNINIGKDCLIGSNFTCINSDFHSISPDDRLNPDKAISKDINIENNVFIGSDVTILKGVTIKENCVIGCGSIVTKSFDKNSVIAGNPAKLIKVIK